MSFFVRRQWGSGVGLADVAGGKSWQSTDGGSNLVPAFTGGNAITVGGGGQLIIPVGNGLELQTANLAAVNTNTADWGFTICGKFVPATATPFFASDHANKTYIKWLASDDSIHYASGNPTDRNAGTGHGLVSGQVKTFTMYRWPSNSTRLVGGAVTEFDAFNTGGNQFNANKFRIGFLDSAGGGSDVQFEVGSIVYWEAGGLGVMSAQDLADLDTLARSLANFTSPSTGTVAVSEVPKDSTNAVLAAAIHALFARQETADTAYAFSPPPSILHNGGKLQTNNALMSRHAFVNAIHTARDGFATLGWGAGSGAPDPAYLSDRNFPLPGNPELPLMTVAWTKLQSTRPGNYVFKSDGNCTLAYGSAAYVSGSASGLNPRVVITPNDISDGGMRVIVGISAVTVTPTKWALVHVDDEAMFDAGEWVTGRVMFQPEFIQWLISCNTGSNRSLNELASCFYPISRAEHLKPAGVAVIGAPDYARAKSVTPTNSGNAYTIASWPAGVTELYHGLALDAKITATATGQATLTTPGGTHPIKGPSARDVYWLLTAGIRYVMIFDAYREGGACWRLMTDTPQGSSMTNGYPVSVIIDLCNQVGCHWWLPMPWMAVSINGGCTDLVDELLTTANRTLGTGLEIELQWGNEMPWNGAVGFAGAQDLQDRAAARWGSSSFMGSYYGAGSSILYKRARQLSNRVRCVTGVQTYGGKDDTFITAAKWVEEAPGTNVAEIPDHVAVATYFTGTLYNSPTEATLAAEFVNVATTEVRRAEILDEYTTAWSSLRDLFLGWAQYAKRLGVKASTPIGPFSGHLLAYEGCHSHDFSSYWHGAQAVDHLRWAARAAQLSTEAGNNIAAFTAQVLYEYAQVGGVRPSSLQLDGGAAYDPTGIADISNPWSILQPDRFTQPMTAQLSAMLAFQNITVVAMPNITKFKVWPRGTQVAVGDEYTWTSDDGLLTFARAAPSTGAHASLNNGGLVLPVNTGYRTTTAVGERAGAVGSWVVVLRALFAAGDYYTGFIMGDEPGGTQFGNIYVASDHIDLYLAGPAPYWFTFALPAGWKNSIGNLMITRDNATGMVRVYWNNVESSTGPLAAGLDMWRVAGRVSLAIGDTNLVSKQQTVETLMLYYGSPDANDRAMLDALATNGGVPAGAGGAVPRLGLGLGLGLAVS